MSNNEKQHAVKYGKEYFLQRNAQRLTNIENNTPEYMKALPNWCVHRSFKDKETGERKKVVLDCHNGKWGNPIDSATWTTFDSALAYARSNNCEGLTFAVQGSGLIAIDIDKCITEGKRNELAWDVLNNTAGSYSETSMSGTGIHTFVRGSLNNIKNKNNAIGLEAYDKAKFISITGSRISKTSELTDCGDKLRTLLTDKLGVKSSTQHRPVGVSSMADGEVIACITRSKIGVKFSKLYSGVDLCGDDSASDMQLLNILAFFTNCDAAQMDSIFRSSGLYRPEKKDAYLQRSITKAIETLEKRPDHLHTPLKSKQSGTIVIKS